MIKKRKDCEFYTTVNDDGQIVLHDQTAEIAAKHAPLPVTQSQLEAWKKAPKEQAVKEVLELIHRQDLDVSEKRLWLDAYRFIAELQGAQTPASQGGNVIQIYIGTPTIPEKRVIDITAQEKKDPAP